MHRRKKVDEKSWVTFLLCDSGWYVQMMSIMNEKKTHTHTQDDRAGLRGYVQFNKYTHTHTHCIVELDFD